MANTYTLIQSVTVGSGGAAKIEFGSIPQTYTDLKVVLSVRFADSAVSNSIGGYINSLAADTNWRSLFGTGAAASSNSDNGVSRFYAGEATAATATANVFGNCEIYIPNYTGSQQKTFSADAVSENNATTAYQFLVASLSTKTAAITTLTLSAKDNGANFVQYSSASLYGIKNS
jgi:hypothetical protein